MIPFSTFLRTGVYLFIFCFPLVLPLRYPTYLTSCRTSRRPEMHRLLSVLPRNDKLPTVQGIARYSVQLLNSAGMLHFFSRLDLHIFFTGTLICIPTKGLALPTLSKRHALLSLRTLGISDGVMFNSVQLISLE